MNLAIRRWKNNPEGNPLSVPGEWPAEYVGLGEETQLPDGSGWELMTAEQYTTHKQTYQSAYDTWLASNEEFQSPEIANAVNLSLSTTTSTSFQQKLRLTTTLRSGNYRIGWSYDWQITSSSCNFKAQIQVDDTTTLSTHTEEAQDPSTDQRHQASGFAYQTLTEGIHNIDLDYCTSSPSGSARIQNARLEIWRIS